MRNVKPSMGMAQRHWSNGQDLRLPSEGSGFNSPVAQIFLESFRIPVSDCMEVLTFVDKVLQ